MNIGNNKINIDDLIDNKYFHHELKNGIFLSDYQMLILDMYKIDYNTCSNINELIFIINDILEENPDFDELDNVLQELSEFNYYNNTNK